MLVGRHNRLLSCLAGEGLQDDLFSRGTFYLLVNLRVFLSIVIISLLNLNHTFLPIVLALIALSLRGDSDF